MPFVSRRADLLERSLRGQTSTDAQVRDLVVTVGRIPALTSPAGAPHAEFVAALGLRLRAEALTLPARKAAHTPVAGEQARDARRATSAGEARRPGRKPLVLVIGRGLPRVLAGITASFLVVAAVVAGTSRSALPGGLFYPVKQLLNQAAVQLAGSDFDRGVTLLSQAQGHISDARALVDRDGAQADPTAVDQALLNAYVAVDTGQRTLLDEFDRTGGPQALVAVQDFVVRALPQLNALRPVVPPGSTPAVDRLLALLQETQTSLARELAVCGQHCASITVGGLPLASLPATATAGGLSAPAPTAVITGPGGVVVGPSLSPVPVTSVPGGVIRPPVTVGSVTLSPTPIVIQTLSPLPLPLPTSAPVLLPPPTVLPSLP